MPDIRHGYSFSVHSEIVYKTDEYLKIIQSPYTGIIFRQYEIFMPGSHVHSMLLAAPIVTFEFLHFCFSFIAFMFLRFIFIFITSED